MKAPDGGSGNGERWQQIKAIVAEALEQQANTRAAFVAERCAGDPALRNEVDSLLDQTTGPLENFADKAAAPLRRDRSRLEAGRRLGPWAIVRELGRGGMGAVYLAERADGAFQQQVAVKILKRGADTDEILRRFEAERQILARLDHPNITRLIDAGTTDDGLPYVVMDYVVGKPITIFAAEKQLSVTERLKLFRSVCGAVSYAHQNLVVHRDLKPSNILVTETGEVRLLDFGIAKLLSDAEAGGADMTITALRVMTPEYASPEQIKGEPITTLSDVYSLGVCLYELLTGARPYKLTRKTSDELSKAICEQEPQRPSTAAGKADGNPKLLATASSSRGGQIPSSKLLRGDLDNIVLMALRKDPARRYASVERFSEDIRRHLEGLPVRARKDTTAYRAAKFIKRHKLGLAAALLLVLTLSAGIIATTIQARRANRRFNEVRKIANSLMFEFHSSIQDIPGALAARQLLTQRAVEYLDSLAQEAGDDLSLKSELATGYDKIGQVIFDIAQKIETHRKAVSLNEELVRAAPANAQYKRQLADSYNDLSDGLKISGHSTESIAAARKALAVTHSFAGENPEDIEIQADLAERYSTLGVAALNAGDFKTALEVDLRALSIQQKVVRRAPSDPLLAKVLAAICGDVSDAHEYAGDYAAALEHSRREFDTTRSYFESDSANARYRRDMWSAYFRVARHLALTGDAPAALEHYKEAVQLIEGLAAADPNDKGHQRWLAVTSFSLGKLLTSLNRDEEARARYEKAIALSEPLLRGDPERFETRSDLAEMHEAMGRLLDKTGQTSGALKSFEQAMAFAESVVARDTQNVRAVVRLAEVYSDIGRGYGKLAEQRDSSVTARKTDFRNARDWHQKSLELWRDLKSKSALRAMDAGKPDEIASELAKYDAALK